MPTRRDPQAASEQSVVAPASPASLALVPSRRAVLLLGLPLLLLLFAPAIKQMVWVAGITDFTLLLLTFLDAELAAHTHLEIERRMPSRLLLGVENKIRYLLRNQSSHALSVQLRDQMPDSFERTPALITLRLAAKAGLESEASVRPPSRGRSRWGGLYARIRGPLGLAFAERLYPLGFDCKVYPDVRAGRMMLSGGARDLGRMGVHVLHREGEGSEIEALRDYVPGDDFRNIDWRATARRQRPIIRVGRPERSQTLILAVDCSRLMAVGSGDLTKLDHAVNAALLTAFVALRGDDRVGVMLFADEVYGFVPPGKGQGQYHRILELLYAARPTRTFVDYRSFARTLLARQPRRALVMTLTEIHDEATTRPLMDQVRLLATRHLPVVLTLRDPTLERFARQAPDDPEGVWQMAAAAELLGERAALRRGLSAAGARILDRNPEEAVLAAVNAYVEIKRRHRL